MTKKKIKKQLLFGVCARNSIPRARFCQIRSDQIVFVNLCLQEVSWDMVMPMLIPMLMLTLRGDVVDWTWGLRLMSLSVRER